HTPPGGALPKPMNTYLLPPEGPPEPGNGNEPDPADLDAAADDDGRPPCVLVFNASDPSGAGGLSGDALAIASVGAHMLGVVTGVFARDTAEVFDHFPLDEEQVAEQARAILEDVQVQVIK